MSVEKMRAFIIKFVFYGIITALIYVILKYVFPFLTPFLLAFLIAFLLKPLINLLAEKTKVKRKIVAVGILIVFYVLAISLLTVLGTRLVIGAKDLFGQLPDFYGSVVEPNLILAQDKLADLFRNLDPGLQTWLESMGDSLMTGLNDTIKNISVSALGVAGSMAGSLPNFLVQLIITIVASFFFMVDYYTITAFITKQLPEKAKTMIFKVKEKGIDVLFRFGKAYALLMFITFAELSVGFALLRVPYAVLWAALISVVDILPVLGTGTVVIPWALISLIVGNLPLGIGLLVLYLIITVVRQTLEPRVVGRQIGLYPVVTLVCMFVGAQLFGVIGLFGLPIAVTVLIHLDRSGEIQLFKR